MPVDHHDTPLYHRPGIVRRVAAAVAGGAIGVLTGVIAAIVTAFAVAAAVIWMTDLLGR